jgi:hypothetical protein
MSLCIACAEMCGRTNKRLGERRKELTPSGRRRIETKFSCSGEVGVSLCVLFLRFEAQAEEGEWAAPR